MPPATLSVVIPTKNAAHLLVDCLESVAWADDIVVVDMHSDDGTDEVCARFPHCRMFRRDDYIFANANFGFEQATGEWILRLDSDERVTPELADEVRAILASPPEDVTGYECWERVFVLGRELRHGWGSRHYRKMLFRRGSAHYPLRREHEDLETSGRWLRTQHGYIHLNYPRVRDYLVKTNYYTDRDVERMVVTRRPKKRTAVVEPLRAFYLNYVKRRGYRDGWIGFLDASMRAVYQLVQWAKTMERWEEERRR